MEPRRGGVEPAPGPRRVSGSGYRTKCFAMFCTDADDDLYKGGGGRAARWITLVEDAVHELLIGLDTPQRYLRAGGVTSREVAAGGSAPWRGAGATAVGPNTAEAALPLAKISALPVHARRGIPGMAVCVSGASAVHSCGCVVVFRAPRARSRILHARKRRFGGIAPKQLSRGTRRGTETTLRPVYLRHVSKFHGFETL